MSLPDDESTADVRKPGPMFSIKWSPRVLVNFKKRSTVQSYAVFRGRRKWGKRHVPLGLTPTFKLRNRLWLNLMIKAVSLLHYLLRRQTHLHTKFCVAVVHVSLKGH